MNECETNSSAQEIGLTMFTADYFREYQGWFVDPEINSQLGPAPDDQWLQNVTHDQQGQHFCAVENGELRAVVGVVFATKKHPFSVVTDLAVHPERRGQQIGRRTIAQLLLQFPQQDSEQKRQRWSAYVANNNRSAIAFFKSIGWLLRSESPDQDEMLEFCYSSGTS